MTRDELERVARRARAVKDRTKRRALLAALKHPDLVSAKLTSSGVQLEGPGGIISTHLSGGSGYDNPAPFLRDLRRVGLA